MNTPIRSLLGASALLLLASGLPAAPVMIVDRGLPTTDLNTGSDLTRSNFAWAKGLLPSEPGRRDLVADSFDVETPFPGYTEVEITTVRLWVVESLAAMYDGFVWDAPSSYTLFVNYHPVDNTTFDDEFLDPIPGVSLMVTPVNYSNGQDYEFRGSPGNFGEIYQLDFTLPNDYLVVPNNTVLFFGLHGTIGSSAVSPPLHAMRGASDAAADTETWEYYSPPTFSYFGAPRIDIDTQAYDTDVNAQIFATPEPSAAALMLAAGGLLPVVLRRRRD